jgi:AcrR family transcriptional regulator
VNPQVKSNPDDTRARIMETAEALFRRLGFAKTAVADIAAELKMSPANVYRFFASKNAIVEAICRTSRRRPGRLRARRARPASGWNGWSLRSWPITRKTC